MKRWKAPCFVHGMWVWINLPLLSEIKGKIERNLFLVQSGLFELWIPYRQESSCTNCSRFSINDCPKSKRAYWIFFPLRCPRARCSNNIIPAWFPVLVWNCSNFNDDFKLHVHVIRLSAAYKHLLTRLKAHVIETIKFRAQVEIWRRSRLDI